MAFLGFFGCLWEGLDLCRHIFRPCPHIDKRTGETSRERTEVKGMERYEGLSSREAAELLAEHGENAIKEKRRSGALAMFAGQFRDALMMILLAATAASAAMGEISEALTHYCNCVPQRCAGLSAGIPHRTDPGETG